MCLGYFNFSTHWFFGGKFFFSFFEFTPSIFLFQIELRGRNLLCRFSKGSKCAFWRFYFFFLSHSPQLQKIGVLADFTNVFSSSYPYLFSKLCSSFTPTTWLLENLAQKAKHCDAFFLNDKSKAPKSYFFSEPSSGTRVQYFERKTLSIELEFDISNWRSLLFE